MSNNTMRQPGWYWVKRPERDWEPAEWAIRTVGHYHYMHWDMPWADTGTDADVNSVGPRIPAPDEPWQCVPKLPALEMIEASGHENSHQAGFAWQAMLAAAPKP